MLCLVEVDGHVNKRSVHMMSAHIDVWKEWNVALRKEGVIMGEGSTCGQGRLPRKRTIFEYIRIS